MTFCKGGDAIVGKLDAIIFNLIASTSLKWLMLKLVRWMLYLHHSFSLARQWFGIV
jgi:hypothetical protein